MALPTKVLNAIRWYCQKMDYMPLMTAYPLLRFKSEAGEIIEIQAASLLVKYDNRKSDI